MSDYTLIRAEGVAKKFCRSLRRSMWYGVRDLGNEIRGRSHGGDGALRPEEFWAVKDISFELNRGECLGLIGRNGGGKTTLLRVLNGLIKLDAGRVTMRGRVGALIALGAGFNPILTGRENIFVNAAVLGLGRRHVDSRLAEIIDFAGIGDFIDMPVQSYSSGMSVRLGFAVAAILIEPDVLLIDEVLAVGDIGFVVKCLNVVSRLTRHAAVVLVSHNMEFISQFCTRVMVLERGHVLVDAAEPAEGIDRYFSLMEHSTAISGTGEAQVRSVELVIDGAVLTDVEPRIQQGTSALVRLAINLERVQSEANIHCFVHDGSMSPVVCLPVCDPDGDLARFPSGEIRIDVPLGALELGAGKYSFVVCVSDHATGEGLARAQGLRPFRIVAKRVQWGKIVRPAVPLGVQGLRSLGGS
jgi:lipopolysaccharide transport system ATP-binding protein